MASPPIVTKGFAKWSLNPDDNATADERVNWQEGQMPSSVNNSARAMMMRGREEHDLIQAQFKAIADTIAGRFGNQVKYLIADTYKITQDTTAGHYIITFQFDDKLTADEYQLYIDRKLYLLTRLVASDIVNDSIYKTWGYNTIISINMAFKVGSNLYTHPMEFYLDFFGIEKYNTVISFHELKHYVNNTMLNRFNGAMVSNLIALPMTRTYVGRRVLPAAEIQNVYSMPEVSVVRDWYYISPSQCVLIECYLCHQSSHNYAALGSIIPSDEAVALLNGTPIVHGALFTSQASVTPGTGGAVVCSMVNYFGEIDTGGAVWKILININTNGKINHPMITTPSVVPIPTNIGETLNAYKYLFNTSPYPIIA